MDADGHEITLAGFEHLGHIHIKGCETAFVITDALAVDENFGPVVNAVEMPGNTLSGKGGRNFHQSAVQPMPSEGLPVRSW